MEDMNKKTNNLAIGAKPFIAMSPSTLSLATGSFEVQKKPYFMTHGCAGSSKSKPCLEPLDGKISAPAEDENKKPQIPSPPFNKNPSTCGAIPFATKGAISLKLEQAIEFELKYGRKVDPTMDPKKLRRMISNRLSAQRSRMKKAQHINAMEKMVKDLQTTIVLTASQIAQHKDHQTMLQMENSVLSQKLDTCIAISKLRNVEIEENKAEVKLLKELKMSQGEQMRPRFYDPRSMKEMNPYQHGFN